MDSLELHERVINGMDIQVEIITHNNTLAFDNEDWIDMLKVLRNGGKVTLTHKKEPKKPTRTIVDIVRTER